MESLRLEKQDPKPVEIDEDAKAAIEIGLAQIERGETVSIEQVEINVKERYKAWRKTQKEILSA